MAQPLALGLAWAPGTCCATGENSFVSSIGKTKPSSHDHAYLDTDEHLAVTGRHRTAARVTFLVNKEGFLTGYNNTQKMV